MLDLSCAYDTFSGLIALLHEGRNVGHVLAKYLGFRILDFFEAFQSRKEGNP